MAYIPGDEIWVASGIYCPEAWSTGGGTRAITSNDRFRHFFLRPGVSIYGGFNGSETELVQRNWKINQTILSGDFNGDDTDLDNDGIPDEAARSENAVHVIYLPNTVDLDQTAVLDGFIIRGGIANLPGHSSGGGIHINGSSPSINNCVITGNFSQDSGAGVFLANSDAVLDNCVITQNSAGLNGGGLALYATKSSAGALVKECIVYKNQAFLMGGGIYIEKGQVIINNSSVIKNNLSDFNARGAGIMVGDDISDLTLNFSILWNNTFDGWRWFEIDTMALKQADFPVCNSCIIQDDNTTDPFDNDGYFIGTSNSKEDPGFLDIENGPGFDLLWFTDDDGIWNL